MKSGDLDIVQMLKSIVGMDKIPMAVLCTVVSVNEEDKTCEAKPIDNGPNFMDVLLMAEPSDTGLYIKPSVDSLIMISPQNSETYYVSMYSAIDEVWVRGEENGGVPKVTPLVEKINNIENDLNDLKQAFTTWVVSPNDGGAALKASSASWAAAVITPTTEEDIESTTVKHG